MTQSVELTQGGLTYWRQLMYDSAAKSVTDSVTITQGSTIVVSATSTWKQGGATSASINYGGPVTGIRSAQITSPDGKTFTGTVDSRQILSNFESPKTPVTTEFLDHRPPGVATSAHDLHPQVRTLATLAMTV